MTDTAPFLRVGQGAAAPLLSAPIDGQHLVHFYEDEAVLLEAVCGLVLKETSLLPHVNGGVMDEHDIVRLRKVSVSQGIMLETVSARLGERGGAHFGSPDKDPQLRLAMIAVPPRLHPISTIGPGTSLVSMRWCRNRYSRSGASANGG